METIKSERRWQVRKLIIAVNLLILGFSYWLDVCAISAPMFSHAIDGFQIASGVWFAADYATKEGGGFK